MTQRSIKEFFDTMKIEAKNENDKSFVECEAEITAFFDVETKFGDKVIANLKNEAQGNFSVFVNNYSMEKLIKAYGPDDEKFIGRIVALSKEKDKNFDKEMIVLNPL